jgi:hypothetical protein
MKNALILKSAGVITNSILSFSLANRTRGTIQDSCKYGTLKNIPHAEDGPLDCCLSILLTVL